jgi:hypothetical protein
MMVRRLFACFVLGAGVCGVPGALVVAPAWADPISYFAPGDLVVSIYGDGSGTGSYGDNQAAPITLQELSLNGTAAATPAGAAAKRAERGGHHADRGRQLDHFR